MADQNKKFETRGIRNQYPRTPFREHSVPLYMTSSFVFDSAEQARALFADEEEGNIYSRFSNPNSEEFIHKIADMEGAEDGFGTASGMSAVFSGIAAFLQSGDHLLASRSLFGSTHQIITKILPRWNIATTYVDVDKPGEWEGAIQDNTRMLLLETPSNPGLGIIDLEFAGNLAKKHNLIFHVDNCFATPYLQQPVKYGADIVTHSATKYIDGQGRAVGGVVVGPEELIKEVRFFCRHTGPAMAPMNAWIFSKSLETLPVRMERHCENAFEIARYFQDDERLNFVKYPFLESHPQYELAQKQMARGGGILTFDLKGGIDKARRFLDNVQMLSHTANLGDARTIVTHPASTTHSKLTEEERERVGVTDGLIRISAGLEHPSDIIKVIEEGLDAI